MSDTLVHYLREARATEVGLKQTLRAHIAATPVGVHRGRLERHLDETARHERLLAERLAVLGDGDPVRDALSLLSAPVGFGLGAARAAARLMLSFVGLPLSLLRNGSDGETDRVLRNVRAEAASEALEVATYIAIERLAEAEGDAETARLAAQIRADEEGMLEYLQQVASELGGALAPRGRQATGHRRQAAGRGSQATGDRRQAAGRGSQATGDRRQATGRGSQATGDRPQATGRRSEAAGSGPQPRPEPRPVEEPSPPPHVSEEPVLVEESAEPGAEETPGPELEVEEPWEGYDRMKADEIVRRVEQSSDEVAAVVRLYEQSGKKRQTVLRAAEHRLRVG